MLQSIEAIQHYTHGLTLDKFRQRRMAQDAVIRRIEILGEAARNIPMSGGSSIPTSLGARSQTCATSHSRLLHRGPGGHLGYYPERSSRVRTPTATTARSRAVAYDLRRAIPG